MPKDLHCSCKDFIELVPVELDVAVVELLLDLHLVLEPVL